MDKTGGFFLVIILAMVLIWVAVNPNLTDMLANKTAEDEDTGGADDGGSNDGMTPRERHNQSIIDYNKRNSGNNMSNALGAVQAATTTPDQTVKNTMGSISKNNVFAPMGIVGGKPAVYVKK